MVFILILFDIKIPYYLKENFEQRPGHSLSRQLQTIFNSQNILNIINYRTNKVSFLLDFTIFISFSLIISLLILIIVLIFFSAITAFVIFHFFILII
jgi:hypothetical protein